LSKAIGMIIKGNDSGSKPKIREPDPFMFQLLKTLHFYPTVQLHFQDHPDMFKSTQLGQLYVILLKGSALDCFKPALLNPNKAIWLSDLTLFIEELKAKFGTYDPIGKAEAELKALRCMIVIKL